MAVNYESDDKCQKDEYHEVLGGNEIRWHFAHLLQQVVLLIE